LALRTGDRANAIEEWKRAVEVFLDPDGARQQVSDEPIRHRVLLVQ
jgi:hypothetical protein